MSAGCRRSPIAKHNIELNNAMPSPNRIPAGTRFSRLLVLRAGIIKIETRGQKSSTSVCRCDCGRIKTIRNYCLRSGASKRCGIKGCCLRPKPITHGLSKTAVHRSWSNMKRRCYNPNDRGFKNYGGRGIAVCKRWRNSFENFYSDMGEKPTPRHSIERIGNNGNYTPSNCKWGTRKEQNNNTRRNRKITYRGITLTLAQWSERLGIKRSLVSDRIRWGWTLDSAFDAPARKCARRDLGKLYRFEAQSGIRFRTLERYFYRAMQRGVSEKRAILETIKKYRKQNIYGRRRKLSFQKST